MWHSHVYAAVLLDALLLMMIVIVIWKLYQRVSLLISDAQYVLDAAIKFELIYFPLTGI